MVKSFLLISEMQRGQLYPFKHAISTNSPEAYRYYIQGRKEFRNIDYFSAINWLSKAIAIDSNFIEPIKMTSLAYGNQYLHETFFSSAFENPDLYEQAKKWCLKAYGKMDQMAMPQQIDTKWIYAMYFGTPFDKIKYLRQLIELDDQWVTAYYNLANSYAKLHQYDKAIPEFEKTLEIYERWGLKPYWVFDYVYLGEAYHKTGQYFKEKKLYKKAEVDFPEDPYLTGRQAILSFSQGDTVSGNHFIGKLVAVLKTLSVSESTIASLLAYVFNEAGVLDKSEESYRQALSFEPNNPRRLNSLAYFLIDSDRDIQEGLELVDQALETVPENYHCLETKGWGLFKQGQVLEALEFLEKCDSLKPVYDHRVFLHLEEVKKAAVHSFPVQRTQSSLRTTISNMK
jgi:tetratricopeptide (TPR) repeat protein